MLRTVAITGAAGRAGRWLRREFAGRYGLKLLDRLQIEDVGDNEESIPLDIADVDRLTSAFLDVEAVVHMAAIPVEDSFEAILHANIRGTWAVYEASRRAKVRRVVLASSNHAVGFYPRATTIDASAPARPDCIYRLSKAWAEDVARYFHDKHALDSLIIRIGNLNEAPVNRRSAAIWCSPRDLAQLCVIGIEHPDVRCSTVFGVSQNDFGWWNNDAAAALGYRPLDRSELHPGCMKPEPEDAQGLVAQYYQGGAFLAAGFTGRLPSTEPSDGNAGDIGIEADDGARSSGCVQRGHE